MSDCNARGGYSSNPGRGKKFTKVMGSDGNCKYLPMFSLSYVKLQFFLHL